MGSFPDPHSFALRCRYYQRVPATLIEPKAAVKPQAKVGGGYTAVDNGNGTFDLLDVPIFSEVPPGAKRNKDRIGVEWMKAAIARNKARLAEGYAPPTHIFHTDEVAVKPLYAGRFILTEIKPIVYEGQSVQALFANITDIPAEVFGLIQKGALPYRSVEIHNWETPEIDSLALMSGDVPFFRFALLTVGEIVKRAPAEMFLAETNPGPARFIRHRDKAMAILFKFGEPMEPKKPEEEVKPEQMMEGAPPAAPEPEKKEPAQDPMMTVILALAEKMSVLDQILQAVTKLAAPAPAAPATGPQPGDPPQADETNLAPVPGMKAEPKDEGSNMDEKKVEAAVLKALTPMVAKIQTLEADNAAQKKAAIFKARMESAEQELRGIALGADAKAHLAKLAALDDENLLKSAVETFKRSLPADPSDVAEHEEGAEQGEVHGEDSQAVAEFTAKHPGPRAAEWARKQASEYRETARLGATDSKLAEWLEINWRHDGRMIERGVQL